MNRNRLVAIGLGVMIAGLVAIAAGVAVASHDLVVGLILLLLVPLSISFCGAVLAFIGLARQPEARSRSAVIRRLPMVTQGAPEGWTRLSDYVFVM